MNAAALLFGAALSIWWVDPYGTEPYLPDSPPKGGVVTNQLSCAAAKGEIETISFSVKPERDMKKVDFVPSDLTGPGGAKIPASCADFALVKCWYRAGGRWTTSWCGHVGKPELINDLVIHDNDLIRVVESTNYTDRTIQLRFDYPDGPAYVDMRKHGRGGEHFAHELHPVKDPKKFVPFDLKKDRFQQYWFTWKIPHDAKPGIYKGSLAVKEADKPLASIPVEIEVYPFALPQARTHYDTSKPYILSMMGTPSIEGELKYSKNLAVTEEKCRNVYRSLAEHNAHQANGPGVFKENSTDDLALRGLILMLQEGMKCDLIINGASCDYMWAANPEAPFIPPEKDPALYKKVLDKYCAMLDVQAAVLDKYLGHRNCYFCGVDECGTYMHRRTYGFFAELNKRGFHAWADSGVAEDIAWSVEMNDAPAAARHTEAWRWHDGSCYCVSYAGTFTGPSCPDIWRRTKGLRYYYNDFDGIHDYCFYYNRWNHWNDFTYRGNYTQMQIVYLTYDGLIPTLAWEGLREGMDDVRYLSLLRLRAQAALKSSDPKIRDLGRDAIIWMDTQDPEAVIDLFAFRREVARRIEALVAVVGEEPEAKPLRPIPELPPCNYGKNIPAGADKAKLADEFVKNNRYDLAIPLLSQLRNDTSKTIDERVNAASLEVSLLSETLRRDEAVKILDDMIAVPTLNTKHRSRLLMQKVMVMTTDKVFEEEFTEQQLNAAAKVLEKALATPGASQRERFEAVIKITSAYLAGNAPALAFDFVEARLKDMNLTGQEKCDLFVLQAKARIAQKDWDGAAKAFRLANGAGNCKTREVFKLEGMVAENREDWKTAQRCYTDEIKTYSKDEEADLIASCKVKVDRVTKKLSEQSKKVEVSIEEVDGGIDLDLDE